MASYRAVGRCAVAALITVICAAGSLAAEPVAPAPPRLAISAPPALAPQVARLRTVDSHRLAALMRLVGLRDAGPPIQVHLVAEDSHLAKATPDWIAGFAHADQVVIFPRRTPSYPHESLHQVLEHEIGHVLIGRAAGGGRVPRWFHEGLAMTAERSWSLGDQAQYVSDVAFGGILPIDQLDPLFEAGPGSASRAYRLSDAIVRDLLERHGPDLPARILASMRAGYPFDRAFQQATAMTVAAAGEAYWNRRWVWATWLPWVTSPNVLYAVMTLMALLGAWRVYSKRRARRHVVDDEQTDASRPEAGAERRLDGPVGRSGGAPWVH